MASEKEDASDLLKNEALQAIKEVSYAVRSIEISTKLPATEECVYMNLLTKEKKQYCIAISKSGFRIMSEKFDSINDDSSSQRYYETIYQLLDSASPEFRNSFGNALMTKLNALAKSQEEGGTS